MSVEKSRERAHLTNAGEFNRAILYADRGDQRKSQSLHWARLAKCGQVCRWLKRKRKSFFCLLNYAYFTWISRILGDDD